MSNYPPGVTGTEYAIAGPEREWSDTRELSCGNDECPASELRVVVVLDLECYDGQEWGTWWCPICGVEQEYEAKVAEPEGLYDTWDEYDADHS